MIREWCAGCPRCGNTPCDCDWGDGPKDIQWFGIVFLPVHTAACIVTRRDSEPTETKHRCWVCYDVLMLHAGFADSDPAVYHLTCRACGTPHLANFPEGEIPTWLEARLLRDAEPRTPDEIADEIANKKAHKQLDDISKRLRSMRRHL